MGNYVKQIEREIISEAEKGFARIMLEILFDKFYPQGKRGIESIVSSWDAVKPLPAPYIDRGNRDNVHYLKRAVKSLTAAPEEWRVSAPSGDKADSILGSFNDDSAVLEDLRAAVSGYRKARADLMGRISKGEDEDLVGENKEWEKTLMFAQKIAKTEVPVMIMGETGSGKDRLAQYIHQHSSRRESGYMAINCGALPESLIISELFGYVDGAFTGAKKGGSRGRLEAAAGGTLLLDDVDALPLAAQAALLRFIETGEIQKVGSVELPHSEVRIICTSNKDLLKLSYEQKFRLDLYYRLSIFKLEAPPLRRRLDDIPLLSLHFLKRLDRMGWNGGLVTISEEAVNYLKQHNWPGNLRELQSVLWRAALESEDGIIRPRNIKFEYANMPLNSDSGGISHDLTAELEKRLNILNFSEGERERLAAFLRDRNGQWFSNRDWAEKVSVSSATARNRLELLVKAGILQREGKKKGTRYRVVEEAGREEE